MAVTTVECPKCFAPVQADRGVIAAHREQIVSAHGWVDGPNGCAGSGRRVIRPLWTQPQPDKDSQ